MPWHVPVAHASTEWRRGRHALATRQLVSMALRVALAQRHAPSRRQAAAGAVAPSSSTAHLVAPSSPYRAPGIAADAAMHNVDGQLVLTASQSTTYAKAEVDTVFGFKSY